MGFLERRVGRCRMLDVVMATLLGITVVLTVILIVTLTQSGAAAKGTTQGHVHDGCIDVAVIGAGIGGAYMGWKLRDRNLSVSVYEYSDRVGGRLLSVPLPADPGTYLELGGMRFLPSAHHILNRTVRELGFEVIDFPMGFGNASERIYYLRGRHMRTGELFTNNTPYNLDPQELGRFTPFLLWDVFSKNVNFSSNTSPSLDEKYSLTTKDGTQLYKMSLDNFFGRYMSREAYKYLHGSGAFDMLIGNHQALFGLEFTYFPGNTGGFGDIKTVKGGMEKVPQTLMTEFTRASTKHKLHLNNQLIGIEKRQDGRFQLRLRKTHTTDGMTTPVKTGGEVKVCASKVVLAAQKSCIEEIDFPVFKNDPEIRKNLDSVIDHPVGKIFLAYNRPWWKTNSPDITHSRTDLPNLQSYDWTTGPSNISVIFASYHDGKNVQYWRELSKFGSPISGSLPGVYAVTDVVKERLERYLSRIYNYSQQDIPEAVGGGMMLWDTYPFQAGWNLFKPGVDERVVQAMIHKPSGPDDVYIVSNSWANADVSSWSEGTLMAAEEVLSKYFTS